MRFGQRCCSVCGRLTLPPTVVFHSPLSGVNVRQGRYEIKRVLKTNEETKVTVAVANDTHMKGQQVVLKRWECTDLPLARRAKELVHYEKATELLLRMRHPLIPRILDRFAEGKHYYIVMTYADGESLEERMQKLLRPLPEGEVLGYMNTLLNILIAIEQQQPSLRPYDLSPTNIIIEKTHGRAMLTGLPIAALPAPHANGSRHRTTRKLAISPYLPIQDKPYDQRTCIFLLAACMHYALTNHAPPHYPTFPPVRLLNPSVSQALEAILSKALLEDQLARYQSYQEIQRDIKKLL